MSESELEEARATDAELEVRGTYGWVVVHLHLVLLACVVWLATFALSVLRGAPLSALVAPATIAQALVFGYGVLVYNSWLIRRPSPRLRLVFWWLPQTVFFTLLAFDPATKKLGAPIGGFGAAMPLQVSVSAGWHLAESSLAISLNLLAIAGVLAARWRPYPRTGPVAEPSQLAVGRARRFASRVLIAAPLIMLVAVAAARGVGVYAWVQQPPPPGLDRITLSSGNVVQVRSIAPVTFPEGGALLLLEYFTELPSTERGDRLAGEIREVWQGFRPSVEKAGYKAAVIAACPRPTTTVYVVPHLKKLGWRLSEDGVWQEIASNATSD